MRRHLEELFGWAQIAHPDARFEIRCLFSSGATKQSYYVNDIDRAIDYATRQNNKGGNIYVVPNIIKPTAPDRFSEDWHILTGLHHFGDADGINTIDDLNLNLDLPISMVVVTGLTPKLRCHVYWRMDEEAPDMALWRHTQRGVAQAHGTDKNVCNPSRAVRLAGCVSYPPEHKRERGYVPELTELLVDRRIIERDHFQIAYPYVPPVSVSASLYDAQYDVTDTSGTVPVAVVAAALAVIPPIYDTGEIAYSNWLKMCWAVQDANLGARMCWEDWQQRGRWRPEDVRLWEQLAKKPPSAGSYLRLFRLAKQADPDWWRGGDLECHEWWWARSSKYYAGLTGHREAISDLPSEPTSGLSGRAEDAPLMGTLHQLFPAKKSVFAATQPPRMTQEDEAELAKELRRAAAARIRQKMIRELSGGARSDY